MKIGLVRHFKVKYPFPTGKWLSASEIHQWAQRYEESGIENGAADLGEIAWDSCYASDLLRAVMTAEQIYEGAIQPTADLREIPIPRLSLPFRMPFWCWAALLRTSWLFHGQTRQEVRSAKRRINRVLDHVLAGRDRQVLIVSHAAMMLYMRKELARRGFRGPRFNLAKNGKLYVYEKK